MKLPSRRPRFELTSREAPAALARRVQAFIDASPRVRGLAQAHRIELSIAGSEHHFWSPQLVAVVSDAPGGGSLIHARFGPDPYVWVLYLLSYLGLAFASLIALTFGAVQLTLGQSPTGLIGAGAAAILAALVYGASFVGQGLGSDQMYLLRATLTDLAEDPPDDAQG